MVLSLSRPAAYGPQSIGSLHRYVALKVEIAKLQNAKQLSIIRYLASKAPQDVNSRFVVSLLDSFVHDGPNGRHLCLVLEPMGPSVSSIINAPQLDYDPRKPQPRRFTNQRIKAILRNVLSGLSFLHHAGVVHGDIHSGNMLLAIQDLTTVEARKLRQDEVDSKFVSLVRSDGKVDKWAPKYLVVSEPLDEYVIRGPDEIVKIIDMGGGTYETKLSGRPYC